MILQCRKSVKSGDVWLKFKLYGFDYTKNYIYSVLSNLAKLGFLRRREINDGGNIGRTVYYTATPEAVIQALNTIEAHALQLRSGVVKAIKPIDKFTSTP